MIAVIDYDAGNIKSAQKALEKLGEEVVLTRDPGVLLAAPKVVLPGVGNFGDAMHKLESYGLVPVIHDVIDKKTPFLAICVGLQLLFEESEEAPGVGGLSILPGKIKKIPETADLKVPQIGWNSLNFSHNARETHPEYHTEKSAIFKGVEEESYVYFVHSYYLEATDPSIVTATTEYGVHIHAAVEKDNIYACQFHPEKSSVVGLKILQNFVEL